MEQKELLQFVRDFIKETPLNHISREDALRDDLCGMPIYDDCLVGVAAADDPLFTREFKKETVIHPLHKAPAEWLRGAQSVISVFLAFSPEVTASNCYREDVPFAPCIQNQRCSTEWLHARIEGQNLMLALCVKLCEYLKSKGYEAVCPPLTEDFSMLIPNRVSNWSERHAAYAAGLGTFGLSRGLITEKGMAGRFGSVITSAKIEPTERPYDSPFAYCILCGACQERCPAGAMDREKGAARGKDIEACAAYVEGSFLIPWGEKKTVRYGCGKCQAGVPCERGIPHPKRGAR